MFNYIALVSQTDQVPNWQVQMVAAALQIQVSRDFTSIWGIDATVSAFDLLEDVPTGYWPIIIKDDIGFAGAAGIHLDHNKKPFGLTVLSDLLFQIFFGRHQFGSPLGHKLLDEPSPMPMAVKVARNNASQKEPYE